MLRIEQLDSRNRPDNSFFQPLQWREAVRGYFKLFFVHGAALLSVSDAGNTQSRFQSSGHFVTLERNAFPLGGLLNVHL